MFKKLLPIALVATIMVAGCGRKSGRDLLQVIEELNNIPMNDPSNTPLHNAAQLDKDESATLLLANSADVNAKNSLDMTPLHYAARHDAIKVATLLLANSADVNAKACFNMTPLHNAAMHNAVKVAGLLLENDAEVDATNNHGSQTPLHLAAKYSEIAMVKLLIAKGAKVDQKDKTDQTPLNYARLREHTETEIEKLLTPQN